jgi:plastocyanin
MSSRALLLALAAAAALTPTPGAAANPPPVPTQIVAGPGGYSSVGTYSTPVVLAVRGQAVTFSSYDIEPHNAVSVKTIGSGRSKRPLFASALYDFGGSGPVNGATKLKPGLYEFYCTLHPWMRGRLAIVAAPATPRAGGGR